MDAVVGGSVLTLVSFLIKKYVKVPDIDCSCFLCRSPPQALEVILVTQISVSKVNIYILY